MILVTGSYGDNKRDYVVNELGIKDTEILNGETCSIDDSKKYRCIENYHKLVKRLIESGINPLEFTENLINENGLSVIVIDEIGCGIVPIEKSERIWRESVGKCGSLIAKNSEKVIRICCGIPVVIKG